MDRSAQTALGSARDRFLEGLSRRADELRAAVRRMTDAPGDEQVREEMRRRLHALHATAQVFEEERLSSAVKTVITELDAGRALGEEGLRTALFALARFADALPSYVGAETVRAQDAQAPAALALDTLLQRQTSERSSELSLLPRSAARLSVELGVAVEQSVAGFLPAPAVSAVLVIDSAAVRARVRELLPAEDFEVLGTADPAEAIRLLHADSPDFALVSGELASLPDLHLVRRLQTDPLSEVRAVYVLLPEGAAYDVEFLRQTGADGVLVEPLDGRTLATLITARTEVARRSVGALASLAEGTVDDVATSFAEEIRRGVVESLQAGRHETVRFDDPGELMAVAWSAIGRVRSHLAEQSRGRIRFRTEAPRDAPTLLALGQDSAAADADASLASALVGRRVLVADDDPAVLWSFSGLLREAGAQVLEAQDGAQALELARRMRPHVVVSDILMPKIDGFALCREIKRDALLAHVPVILLSWKEDFLQRMRELDSGASGYLRKEAGTRQIIAGLADVLRPRTRLEEHLRAGGEVRGRIEGLGVWPLLETVAVARPNARISVRDAWNLFEVDLRGGEELGITRTAADGSFARGMKALFQLVGVNSGRFAVTDAEAPLRNGLADPLGKALLDAGKQLGALLDAVSGTRLLHLASLAFDDEVLASLLNAIPTPLADVAARFRTGSASVHEMLLDGAFTPADLEENLRELARRGAIVGVWSQSGEDLVALCRQEREARPGTLLHAASPSHRSVAPAAAAQGGDLVLPLSIDAAASAQAALLYPDAQSDGELVTATDPTQAGAIEFSTDTGAPTGTAGLLLVPAADDAGRSESADTALREHDPAPALPAETETASAR